MSSSNTKTDLNSKAVKAMWNEGNKPQPAEQTLKNCEAIMKNAFDEAEKEIGRPMTYSEMRARFG
jgi:hypothetical protein